MGVLFVCHVWPPELIDTIPHLRFPWISVLVVTSGISEYFPSMV